METTIGTPVITDDIESKLREAAGKVDSGEAFELPSAEQSEQRATDTTAADTSSPDITPEKKQDRPRDEQGRFTKTESGEEIPEELREPAAGDQSGENHQQTNKKSDKEKDLASGDQSEQNKPESAYVKAQKEQERLGKSWQQLEAEKAQVRAEAQRLEQERQQWLREREEARTRNGTHEPEHSSQEYAAFAEQCTKEAEELRAAGDYDAADEKLKLATRATKASWQAHEREQVARQEQSATQYQSAWEQDMQVRMQQVPELAKPDSELSKSVQSLLSGPHAEVFERTPNGFSLAVEVAQLNLKAGAASGLEEQNKKLQAEVEDLRKRTAIGGSGPTSPTRSKSFNEMNDEEQEAYLRHQSENVMISS